MSFIYSSLFLNTSFTYYSMPDDEGEGYYEAHTYHILKNQVYKDYGGNVKKVFDNCNVKNKNNWICTENYGEFGVTNGNYFGKNSHGKWHGWHGLGKTVSKFEWAYSWCARSEMNTAFDPLICASMFILPGRMF